MIKKVFALLYVSFCKLLFYINHRWYMKIYIPYLKWSGTHILGTPRYIGIHVRFDDYHLIEIGNNTTISDDCHLLTHDYSITNVMRAVRVEFPKDIALVRDIKIGNNVFIGKKSIIMPNARIGNNCVIGAGSVIRGIVPDNTVWGGNPAQCFSSVEELAEKWMMYINNDKIRRD